MIKYARHWKKMMMTTTTLLLRCDTLQHRLASLSRNTLLAGYSYILSTT